MVSEKQKRLNSSVYLLSDISKPEGNSKSTQAGKGLVSSRSRPNFCIFCKARHSTLACPQLDPVTAVDDPATDSDETSSDVMDPTLTLLHATEPRLIKQRLIKQRLILFAV